MKGSEWCESLTMSNSANIQAKTIKAVVDGNWLPFCWQPVQVVYGSNNNVHKGVIFVGKEPLRIGTHTDYVYPMVSAKTAQTIADTINVLQPTTKIIDEIYQTGHLKVSNIPMQPADAFERAHRGFSPSMSDAGAMQRFSFDITNIIGWLPGLVSFPFKTWVITNRLATADKTKAYNYGFFDESAPYRSASGFKMWQTLGSKHDCNHFDYSQVFIAVHPSMLVDGEWHSVVAVGNHTSLCGLVSNEGIVKTWRHQSVPLPSSEEEPPISDRSIPVTKLSFSRALKMTTPILKGEDVAQWQRFLQLVDDGVFGRQTRAATIEFQLHHGLSPDGVVGDNTAKAANETLSIKASSTAAKPGITISQFRQAKCYRRERRTEEEIRFIVLHTAEILESPTSAESLMKWAAGPDAPRASWHYAVDNDSITQSVKDEDIAWHAGGISPHSIGIEMCGYARQSKEEWSDEYSIDMLNRTASLVAALCTKWNIPVRFISESELQQPGIRGITTHNAYTLSSHKGDHTDPGPNFPMDRFIARVKSLVSS